MPRIVLLARSPELVSMLDTHFELVASTLQDAVGKLYVGRGEVILLPAPVRTTANTYLLAIDVYGVVAPFSFNFGSDLQTVLAQEWSKALKAAALEDLRVAFPNNEVAIQVFYDQKEPGNYQASVAEILKSAKDESRH